MSRLARSIMLGLALLWLTGVIGSAVVLQRLIDGKSDDELQETGLILVSFISRTPDLAVTASVLRDAQARAAEHPPHDRFAYRVVDEAGQVLLHSANTPAIGVLTPLHEGLADVDDWRIATLRDEANGRYLQVADPLPERREALLAAVLWLTAPLAVLLAFAAFMVLRASRSLMATCSGPRRWWANATRRRWACCRCPGSPRKCVRPWKPPTSSSAACPRRWRRSAALPTTARTNCARPSRPHWRRRS